MTTMPLDVYEELAEERHALAGLTAPDAPPEADFERVRAVAFDLDATLVDFIGMKRRQCRDAARAMRRAGHPMPAREAAQRLFDTCLDHGIDWDGILEIFLIDTLGLVDPDILAAGEAAWTRAEDQARPFPGVRATLRALRARGYRLAIITDAPGAKARRRLAATGLIGLFDHVITPEDHPRGKGDARPFQDLLDRWGLAPHEVAMVGDNPGRDVRHARRLGLPTVLARYGLQDAFRSDHPHDVAHADIDGAPELLDLLPGAELASSDATSAPAPARPATHQTFLAPDGYPNGRLAAWFA